MENSLQDNNSKQKNKNFSESDSSIKVQHFLENFDFLGQVLLDKKEQNKEYLKSDSRCDKTKGIFTNTWVTDNCYLFKCRGILVCREGNGIMPG
jgi:hypothetical protein